jgi:hypothetical protein
MIQFRRCSGVAILRRQQGAEQRHIVHVVVGHHDGEAFDVALGRPFDAASIFGGASAGCRWRLEIGGGTGVSPVGLG